MGLARKGYGFQRGKRNSSTLYLECNGHTRDKTVWN